MRGMTGLAAMAVALVMGSAVSPAAAYQSKQVRDYYVACSNGLTCELAIHDFDSPLTGLAVERKGGPASPVAVRLDMAQALADGRVLSVRVDEGAAVIIPHSALIKEPDTPVYRLTDEMLVDALLTVFADGASAEIAYMTGEGEGRSRYSLAGMKAGMLYMDEVQGRLNTSDALVAKGERAPDAPKVQDIDAFDQLPQAIRGDFAGEDGRCSFLDAKRFSNIGGFEAEIHDDVYLIGAPCSEGGAYNQPFVFYLRVGADVAPLHLPVMTQFGPSTEAFAWNVSWNHRERIMEALFKGRGLGDCGVFNRWVLADQGPAPGFILRESRIKDDCDGDNLGGVEFWPLIWPPS